MLTFWYDDGDKDESFSVRGKDELVYEDLVRRAINENTTLTVPYKNGFRDIVRVDDGDDETVYMCPVACYAEPSDFDLLNE